MKGENTTILKFLRGEEKYSIPVYQRDYCWGKEQCRQLYDDLISLIAEGRKNHFFGSIVDAEDKASSKKYGRIIIDGQQRITTITIFAIALDNVVSHGLFNLGDMELETHTEKIKRILKTDEGVVKLQPAPNCIDAFNALLSENETEFIESSNITENFLYFCKRLEEDKENYTAEQIWDGLDKLTIIDIYLQDDDNAQLIFESINSTGLELSESDKIRNYLMMALDIKEQERYYYEYWRKIEENTENRCDYFIRDFLTIRTRTIPNLGSIYDAFKVYARNQNNEQIIKSMYRFSRFYRMIKHPDTAPERFRPALFGIQHLDMSVADPYLMSLFEEYDDDLIPEQESGKAIDTIEIYLFRRNICKVPTNALNKIFVTLHADAKKLRGNTDSYSERIAYLLLKMDGSGILPRDDKFIQELGERDIYTMSKRSKLYLLERLENFDNNESHDIYALTDEGKCTIEHVMPQTLSDDWKQALGPDAESIHKTWLHRLANLTFTGYNSKYSNLPFTSKLTMEHGFRNSTYSLNRFIAGKTCWGEQELKERQQLLCAKALKIWPEPKTSFVEDVEKTSGFISLTEDYNFTGKTVKGFSFEKTYYTVETWKDLIVLLSQLLYEKDREKMQTLSRTTSNYGPANFITASEHDFEPGKLSEIKDGIFIYTSNSTKDKIRFMKYLLEYYSFPETSVEIDVRNINEIQVDIHELSYRFWQKLLPQLNDKTPLFSNRTPSHDNWLTAPSSVFSRMRYRIVFTLTRCLIGFEFSTSNQERNLQIFDLMHAEKERIEESFGEKLDWIRNENKIASFVQCYAENCHLRKESSWQNAIEFICEKLPKFHVAFQPVLEQYRSVDTSGTDEDEFEYEEKEDDGYPEQ